MTSAPEPVASGQGYTISHIDGHQPTSLEDFTGDIHLTLIRNGQQLEVKGSAAHTADSVRFYQKDLALPHRDIRVWEISELPDSTFVAASVAAF